ncbi:UDP-N-acetylmuramate dehydrogenase [Aidingimonas lacisalsi]|uniref:UDP-N-acetylmuramate dehydrogenase n=1 Tax=Aidingimonas lacisalsi TaxID=2604086 RepID=UPI0011D2A77C|nr:UDP-N-acetylmuramate dehydrogenase [Aidingimonas lacisalsi]
MTLEWQRDRDLTDANTLRLVCRADRYVAAETPEELQRACLVAHEQGWPLTVLGGGSNLVLGPRLGGLTVKPVFAQWWQESIDTDTVRIHADAGVTWHDLVMSVAQQGLWGIENLALIPGHCGAAPIQNIGAYGVELADVLESVEVLDPENGDLAVMSAADCEFGYRDSVFKRDLSGRAIITRMVLRLDRRACPRLDYGNLAECVGRPDPTALDVAEAVCRVRRDKLPDPTVLGNAGSFFKNPIVTAHHADALFHEYPELPHFALPDGRVKIAAGWLIERCGFKGVRQGAFGVHERQALVLVHHGGGEAAELLAFADDIARQVSERFDVMLEREPRVIGA